MDVRLVNPLTKQCERARECASLRLDGELSEFESALLNAHLARCEGCRAFADELGGVTTTLRDAPLETLEQPVALPTRRRISSRRPVEIAAAAALMLTSLSVAGALRTAQSSSPSLNFGSPAVSTVAESREFSDIRRAMLRRSVVQQPSPGGLNLLQS